MPSFQSIRKAFKVFSYREFWRKRIGNDKTRCLMSDVATAFLEEMKDKINKADGNNLLIERVLKVRVDYQVCLRRILSTHWNGNSDEWATVYELNDATRGEEGDALEVTLNTLLDERNNFCSSIEFTALELEKRK